MLAIYKRELKSYLTSMVGYLFMFFVLLIAGIYFSAYQLTAASGDAVAYDLISRSHSKWDGNL